MSRSRRSTDFPSRGSIRSSIGHTPLPARGPAPGLRCTTISRVTTVAQSADASMAHKYRLPGSRRGRCDFGKPEIGRAAATACSFVAATCPFGAISESSPSSGFSAANTTRKGAPFHGAMGEASMVSPTSSLQVSIGACGSGLALAARWAAKAVVEAASAHAISNDAIAQQQQQIGAQASLEPPMQFRRRTQEYPEMLGAIMANCTPPAASANRRTAPRRGRNPSASVAAPCSGQTGRPDRAL